MKFLTHRNTRRKFRIAIIGLLAVGAIGGSVALFYQRPQIARASAVGPRLATSTSDCTDDASIGTTAWTSPGNAALNNGSTTASITLGKTTASHYILCKNFGFTTGMIPSTATINGIVVTIQHTSNNNQVVDNAMRIVKGGVIGTTDRKTTNSWSSTSADDHGSATDLWGTTWAVSDITSSGFGAAISAINNNSQSKTANVWAVQITVYYSGGPSLAQRHYIFQQDDGANVNSNSNNGSADTALTNVKKGERLNTRFQVDNTGSGDWSNSQFGLYYDRNDNIWTQVKPGTAVTSGSGCASSDYTCTQVVGSLANTTTSVPMVLDTQGNPWVAYSTSTSLMAAHYVGIGGSGCTSSAWTCTTVDAEVVAAGEQIAMALDQSGNPWIFFLTGSTLKTAQYVGSGGTGCTSSTTWTCANVATGISTATNLTIGINSWGSQWIAFNNGSAGLMVGRYAGGGATGCAGSPLYSCSTIDTSANVGQYLSIAFDSGGLPWISYYDTTNGDLKVAQYVIASGSGCAVTTWSCTSVDTTGTVGQYISIALDKSDNPSVSYYDSTNGDLKVATYVGGTSGSGCASTAWNCTSVDTTNNVGQGTSIGYDPVGHLWVSYYDVTNGDLRVARNVGGSSGTGCAVTSWTCVAVESTNDVGKFTSIEFGPTGTPWVTYLDTTNTAVRAAQLQRGSEIIPGYGMSGSNGDALTSNAAGTCTTGTTFSNGEWQDGVTNSSSLTIASNKCTEVSFNIDTSQATTGTTYRLALRDMTHSKGLGAYSVFPTLTIVSSGSDTIRASKDHIDRLGSPTSCTDTNWDCVAVNGYNAAASQYDGRFNRMAFDANGNPWFVGEDNQNKKLYVTNYTPGTAASGQCAANWTCTVLTNDGTNEMGVGSVIKFDQSGIPWVVYQDWTRKYLFVAQYVGNGGSGCGSGGSTAWTCTTVNNNAAIGEQMDIAFDAANTAWVAYDNFSTGDLYVAHYTPGTSASGNCAANWTCTTAATGVGATWNRMVIDSNNIKHIYSNNYAGGKITEYTSVGVGGSCTGGGGVWNCTDILSGLTASVDRQLDAALDSSGNPWVSYYDAANTALGLAQYVGSGGTGCTSTAWTCIDVDNNVGGTTTTGQYSGLDFDQSGIPYISYYDTTTNALKVAIRNGGGSGSCTDANWNCSVVDHISASSGQWSKLVIDQSGVPWVAYQDLTNGDSKVAKLRYPVGKKEVRYKLDNLGYTGIASADSSYDSLPATSFTPLFRFNTLGSSNTGNIQPTWVGQSSVAASSDNIKLQVWRGGTTNAWVDMATNTTCAANSACTITPTAITINLSDYYEASGSQYITRFRVYQIAGSSQTLKSDCFSAGSGCSAIPTPSNDQLMRHGTWFNNGVKQPMTF